MASIKRSPQPNTLLLQGLRCLRAHRKSEVEIPIYIYIRPATSTCPSTLEPNALNFARIPYSVYTLVCSTGTGSFRHLKRDKGILEDISTYWWIATLLIEFTAFSLVPQADLPTSCQGTLSSWVGYSVLP